MGPVRALWGRGRQYGAGEGSVGLVRALWQHSLPRTWLWTPPTFTAKDLTFDAANTAKALALDVVTIHC